MRRCIYTDKFKSDIKEIAEINGGSFTEFEVLGILSGQPTADVRENEHAYWILDPDGMDWGLPAWKCSRCGVVNNNIGVVEDTGGLKQNPFLWSGSKYCPNCGAEMER